MVTGCVNLPSLVREFGVHCQHESSHIGKFDGLTLTGEGSTFSVKLQGAQAEAAATFRRRSFGNHSDESRCSTRLDNLDSGIQRNHERKEVSARTE